MSANWKTKPLGSVATLQRGFDLPARLRKPGTVPIVTSSGIEDRHYESKVKGPGVITGRYGTIGKVFFVRDHFWPLNTTLYVCDFHKNDPLFISYLLRTIDFHTHSGKSGVPGVNRNDLHEIVVALPPTKAEQEAIAEALSDADALIESLDQLLAKKRHLKQAAMQELLTGKKRLPGFEGKPGYKQTELGLIPEDWEMETIGNLFNISGGLSASRDQLGADGHCYLHYGDIHTSSKSFVDVPSEIADIPKLPIPLGKVSSVSLLKDGDVVFVDASEDEAGTSKHVVINNPENIPFISGLHTIVAKSKSNTLDHLYRRYCFQTSAIKKQIRFFAVGTKVLGISKSNIVKIMIPLPSVPEQTAIATILSDMDTEIAALEAKLAKARQLKQGMMQELLTGRIRLIN